jgi:predicted house-cleaning NTP pyrophosphatase (Maf/HAM1 superfamily)
MKVFTDSEARQNLEQLLGEAQKDGAVGIRQKDGQTFILRPENISESPLNVAGLNLPITTEEIIGFVHEGRRGG